MIDLSNNNSTVNFATVRAHGQRRVYLKRSEGVNFVDDTFNARYHSAKRAGLHVGAYHFARPSQSSARAEAEFFCRLLPKLEPGKSLRPCLDLEDPNETPGPHLAAWANEWLDYVRAHTGYAPIIYGGAWYLEPCRFQRIPVSLWLAAYGRNDGKEYPYKIPKPWTQRRVIAHQYASTAHVPGVAGQCDLSRVLHPHWLTVHRLSR